MKMSKKLTSQQKARNKEKKNNLRKYKYALVYNIYQRDDVAKASRSWSFETIQDRLGIPIPSVTRYRVPEIKHVASKKRKQDYINYLEHRSKGYVKEYAFKERRKKWLPFIVDIKEPVSKGLLSKWKEDARVRDWKIWSSSKQYEEFPAWIREYARHYNHQEKIKAMGSYGYALMYYRYVRGWDEESAFDYVKPDKNSILSYYYTGAMRI